jgi:hypothetical protein
VQLPPEQMRALGYQVVDLLVERLNDPGIPALKRATAPEMAKRIAGPPPASPQEFGAVLQRLQDDVLPYMNRADHPRFFAFIPSCQTFPGALGDFIASALNVYVGSWMEAAGPSQVELTVIDWFKDWMGYPERRQRGEHDRAGVRARGTDRGDVRPRRRLRVRPGALLARACRAAARLPPRPAARPARRH